MNAYLQGLLALCLTMLSVLAFVFRFGGALQLRGGGPGGGAAAGTPVRG